MPAYLKIGDIKGEVTDANHKDWIAMDAISNGVSRTIPPAAKDAARARGDTMLSDVSITRTMDKSSVKLQEACASGKFFTEAEIHLCTTIKEKQQPYFEMKIKNVVISSYSFAGTGSNEPSESLSLSFTAVEWTYIVLDPNTGDNKGNVPAKYEPPTGKAT
jgi:type VI secretion system secreted protein Hcp